MPPQLTIRKSTRSDCREIIRLIKELADYEEMPQGPQLTEEILIRDGFDSPHPRYHCLVAESSDAAPDTLVGYCLYYNIYSAWVGKGVYMEDLYVTPSVRGLGLGKRLWQEVTKRALEDGGSRVKWCCLDWNKPSIDFYERNGAKNYSEAEGWLDIRMDKSAMEDFVKNIKMIDYISVVQ